MPRRAAVRRLVAGLGVLLVSLAAAAPARAQAQGVVIGPGVEGSLLQLQERWNRWLAAFYQDDPETAREVADELRAAVHELGMTALPDLARGALVRGVEAARKRDFPRARWALAAAERLDPGRPETAYAYAAVERLEGRWLAAAGSWFDGAARTLRQPMELRLWLYDLGIYALYCLLLAGGLFVALAMAVHGRALLDDLAVHLRRHLPRPAVLPAVLLVLVWPLALPAGLGWLALYWSVLLWVYAPRPQRGVLLAVWLLSALSALGVDWTRQRVALELSPPVRAMEEAQRGRLYGGLFSDLGALQATLPDDPAVLQLMADVYRRIGEREHARSLYRQVLSEEPRNAAAMIDLGSYYFYRGDYRSAIELFTRATRVGPNDPRAHFDLSQAYSNAYLFTDSRRALAQAQQLSTLAISRWINEVGDRGVKSADGGLARVEEVRGRLAEVFYHPVLGDHTALLRRGWGLLMVLAALLAAWGLGRLLPARPGRGEMAGEWSAPGLEESRWRALVPGAASLLAGRGVGAYLALLLPAALLLLPLAGALGMAVPAAYAGGGVAVPMAAAGLALLFATRTLTAVRGGSR